MSGWIDNLFEETVNKYRCSAKHCERWITPGGYYKRWDRIFIHVPKNIVGRLPRVNELEGTWNFGFLSYIPRNNDLSTGVWIALDVDYETPIEELKRRCRQFISTLDSNLRPQGSKLYGVMGEVIREWVQEWGILVTHRAGRSYVSIHYTKEEAEQAMKKYQDDHKALDARSAWLLGYRTYFNPWCKLEVVEFDPSKDTYPR